MPQGSLFINANTASATMQTPTVQNSPINSGTTTPTRAPNFGEPDEGQFQQALNRQIERQGAALPPVPAVGNAAPRRAEAPKPAPAPRPASQPAPQPKPAQQAAAPSQAGKPASAAPAGAPAPAGSNQAAAETANAGSTDAGSPDSTSAAAGAGEHADAATETQDASDPIADMLMLMSALNQPAVAAQPAAAPASGAAAAAMAGASAGLLANADSAALRAAWPGMAAGGLPPEGADLEQAIASLQNEIDSHATATPADGVDLAAMHETLAKLVQRNQAAADADAGAIAGGKVSAGTGMVAGNAAASAAPQADFQAALAQASAHAEAAAAPAGQPPAPLAAVQLPASAAAQAQAVHAAHAGHIPARVGSQGWDQQVGQKLVFMAKGGDHSATLTLNPPDLGPLQIVLNVSNDQASVAFTASQPEVRQALEQAMSKLRDSMGEAGIQLGEASVSEGSQEQQQAFAEMAAAQRGRAAGQGGAGQDEHAGQAERPAHQARRAILGAVDTFA